jgi:glycosyltransferase involved in cell wall biosynthesis
MTAVVLSNRPVRLALEGVTVMPFMSEFSDAAGLLNARLAALQHVKTEWFFFLDDDDELPADYLRVLERCVSAGTPIAYTDELITAADGSQRVRKSAAYSEDAFIANQLLIHHLAVCRADAARRAAAVIPRGMYAVENLLFFEVAKGGATYIPEIGYIWHRRDTGLNRHWSLTFGLVQSAAWALRNRSK